VQLLLGHAKLESTVRHLGIEVDAALEISEQTEIRSRHAEGRPRVGQNKAAGGLLCRTRDPTRRLQVRP